MALDYDTIAGVIRHLDAHADEQPSLEELAAGVGASPTHLQRVFKRWAGVSPKRFLQVATASTAKDLLRGHESVLEASYGAGLSGPGRLHDLIVAVDAVTPGEYKSRGAGLTIRWGWHDSPFGPALIAVSDRGVVALYFAAEGVEDESRLESEWSGATLVEDPAATVPVARAVFEDGGSVSLLLRGTNLQVKVWEALLRIPEGRAVTYSDVAEAVGKPDAVRAVASAVGRNPISWLIPCHRVLRATGALGGYHWGLERKRAMLTWEAARSA
jgi:AraC family transcriptional regulator of adaptative response/methylated-DNA-[protein]-cysteine methyltransferase